MGNDPIQNNSIGNVAWNKQLADKLDAADGKKDGKISASIWNDFINQSGSNGNKINVSISVENASKSFNYYNNVKDKGTIDWKNNWQELFNKILKRENVENTTPTAQNTQQLLSPADILKQKPHTIATKAITNNDIQKALNETSVEKAVNELLEKSPIGLSSQPSNADIEKLGYQKVTTYQIPHPGAPVEYLSDKGHIMVYDGTGTAENGENERKIVYKNGDIEQTIYYDESGNFQKGEIKSNGKILFTFNKTEDEKINYTKSSVQNTSIRNKDGIELKDSNRPADKIPFISIPYIKMPLKKECPVSEADLTLAKMNGGKSVRTSNGILELSDNGKQWKLKNSEGKTIALGDVDGDCHWGEWLYDENGKISQTISRSADGSLDSAYIDNYDATGRKTERIELNNKGKIVEISKFEDPNHPYTETETHEFNEDGSLVLITKREDTNNGRRIINYDSNGNLINYIDTEYEYMPTGLGYEAPRSKKTIHRGNEGNVTQYTIYEYSSDNDKFKPSKEITYDAAGKILYYETNGKKFKPDGTPFKNE